VAGGEAAGVAGVPRLDQLEGAAVADFADDDPVGAEAHGVHDRTLPGVDGGLNQNLDSVRGSALELPVVLDQVHQVACLGDLGEAIRREGTYSMGQPALSWASERAIEFAAAGVQPELPRSAAAPRRR
jgi:hypothetical protein